MSLAGPADIIRYRHSVVRDLAWALLSPPLLAPKDDDVQWFGPDWCSQVFAAYRGRLDRLDLNPAPLLEHLQARSDRRLGSRFEGLLHFWLADPANSQYRLLAHNLPIRQGKLTLGELDFVVRELASGTTQHWEVAVRFYLATRPGGDHRDCIGIDPSDRLDLKVGRLRQHQLPMSQTPAGRAALAGLGVGDSRAACLLKGRLFYPAGQPREPWFPREACPLHGQGWWLPAADLPARFTDSGLLWSRLPREYRLAPLTPDVRLDAEHTATELLEHLPGEFDNRPVAVVGRRHGQEEERGFLTPSHWPSPPQPKDTA